MTCCCSVAKLCPTLVTSWTAAHQAPMSSTISQSLLKFMSIELVMLSNHLILCNPPSSFCLRSFPASGSFPMSQLFVSGGKTLEFQFHHQSFQWIFRIDFFQDWLCWSPCCPRVFSSTIWKNQFFDLQPSLWFNSHPYMTTRKTIGLTIWSFVGKVMSLLFDMLSRLS